MTDINLGIYHRDKLDPARSISATSRKAFDPVSQPTKKCAFKDFLRGLLALPLRRPQTGQDSPSEADQSVPGSKSAKPLDGQALFERVGMPLFLRHRGGGRRRRALVRGPRICFSTSDRFLGRPIMPRWVLPSLPASARNWPTLNLASLGLVGDGAFQMTGMESATSARYKLNPRRVVLNNRGYGHRTPYTRTVLIMTYGPWHYSRFARGFLGAVTAGSLILKSKTRPVR